LKMTISICSLCRSSSWYAMTRYKLAPLGLLIAEDSGWKSHLSFLFAW
jgi:hypothetical protein